MWRLQYSECACSEYRPRPSSCLPIHDKKKEKNKTKRGACQHPCLVSDRYAELCVMEAWAATKAAGGNSGCMRGDQCPGGGGGPWRGRVSELPLYWIDLLVTYVVFTLFSVCSAENKWTVLLSNSISAISVVHQLFVLIWKLKWKSIRWESLKSIDFHFNFL